jgi:hypothetical protein
MSRKSKNGILVKTSEGFNKNGTCPGCKFLGEEQSKVVHTELYHWDGEDLCFDCFEYAKQEAEDEMHAYDNDEDHYDRIDGVGFADEGGGSALRAATRDNPRNLPCPKCGAEDVLTPIDRAHHYVCDRCADAAEKGYDY